MMIEFIAEDDQPLRVWDQDTQKMTEIQKVPNDGWRSAWGKYACNDMNNIVQFWDLEARKLIELPLPEGVAINDLICDHDQTTLLVTTTAGPIYVINLKEIKPIAVLENPSAAGRTSLTLSQDDRLLFWQTDLTQCNRETGERSNEKTQIAVFDVTSLINSKH